MTIYTLVTVGQNPNTHTICGLKKKTTDGIVIARAMHIVRYVDTTQN